MINYVLELYFLKYNKYLKNLEMDKNSSIRTTMLKCMYTFHIINGDLTIFLTKHNISDHCCMNKTKETIKLSGLWPL